MRLDEFKWRGINRNISDNDILQFENKNKIKLPEDYNVAILKFNGGTPSNCSFSYEDPILGTVYTALGTMFSFCESDEENVYQIFEWIKDRLPDRVYPIFNDGSGDCVCLDYRNTEGSPKIVYWCHELSPKDSIVPLADNFTNFIENKLCKES